MTNFVMISWVTRIEDYHTVYLMPNAKLLPMIEDSFALALSSWQAAMIENLHFSTNQNVFLDVPGYAVTDQFVLFDFDA